MMNINESNHVFNKRMGWNIRKYRKKASLTGRELAKFLFLSQQQISRIECGACGLTVYQLNAFLKNLNVTWDEFISDMNNNSEFK